MAVDVSETRRRSAALFGNEKVVEVVLSMNDLPSPQTATAAEISRSAQIAHGMVRDVLRRLVGADILIALPKVGSSRSAQFYQVSDEAGWTRIVETARWAQVRAATSDRT